MNPNDGKGSDPYDLEERLLEYSVVVVRFVESMHLSDSGRHVAKQLMRSGTAPMAHHGEAQAAESADDFVHKMSIALKELRESVRWLELTQRVPLTNQGDDVTALITETDELIRIFYTSIKTAKKRRVP
jgi:four helix bundle protein